MTHEELVEKVASMLWDHHQKFHGETDLRGWTEILKHSRYKWIVLPFRAQAREVVEIVGEACAENKRIAELEAALIKAHDDMAKGINTVRQALKGGKTDG